MRLVKLILDVLGLAVAVLAAGQSAAANEAAPVQPVDQALTSFVAQVREDADWLAGFSTRVVGFPDHDRAVQELLEKVKAVEGVQVWTQEFPMVMPEVLQADLTVDGGRWQGVHRVYPLWPANVRLNTTPLEGISGRLIYVGEAEPDQLPARSLRGQIAVMEMSGGDNWKSAANFGARAVILLGSPKENCHHAQTHSVPFPLNVPRFYVPEGALADALRNGEIAEGRLLARGQWRKVTATNIYALVKPPSSGGQPALAIGAPFDSMSIVPELAPGADVAVDAAVVLNALRYFASHPPARPLLFCFVDGYAINQYGVRRLLEALAIAPSEKRDYAQEDREMLDEYREHERLAAELDASPEGFRKIFQKKYWPLHPYVKDEVDREVVVIETEMAPLRLAMYATSGEEKARIKKRVDELTKRRDEFFATRARMLSKPKGTGGNEEMARTLWQRARQRIGQQLRDLEARLAFEEKNAELRRQLCEALGLDPQVGRPFPFMLGIDLSDAGIAAGPCSYCRYLHVDGVQQAANFNRWLIELDRKEGDTVWPGALRRAVNLSPLGGVESVDSHTVGEYSLLTSPAQSFGVSGVTWMTLDSPRLRVDTARDRAELLDWKRLAPQVDATLALLKRLAADNSFTQVAKITPKWSRVRGTIVDQATGEPVPRLPMNGYVTTLATGDCGAGRGRIWYFPRVPGIRRNEFRITGADGTFLFDLLPGHAHGATLFFHVQSYWLAPDGSILRSVDLNKATQGVPFDVSGHDRSPRPLRVLVFTCRELHGLQFFDPRFLQPLPSATVLDAQRGGEPRKMTTWFWSDMMSCLLEPGMRWQLVLRAGVTRNRMMLVNMMEPEAARGLTQMQAMRGFPVEEPLPQHPIYLAARDTYRLDKWRMDDYRRAGISIPSVDQLQERSAALLKEAERALEADDGGAHFRAATGAMANEVRAYQAVRDTADDVVRGAMFLLIGLVPFAFALERLLFATPYIYRQIGCVIAIFLLMAAALWSFHPAFRISSQPLMIVIAFMIIAMSVLVISVVYSKFESGLKEMRSGLAETSGAHTSRFGLLSTAVRLGIANMRKRKLRTALTGTTVVLVTFALLCFVSTSSYVGQKELSLKGKPAYTGVLLRQPAQRPLPGEAHAYLENVLGKGYTVATRYWWSNPWNPQWRLHVRNPATGKQISLPAALGFDGNESAMAGVAKVCPDWERFASEGGCYLASETAEQLGVKPGEEVVVAGQSLKLIGVFDTVQFNQEVRDLDGSSLLPTDYSALGAEERGRLARGDLEIMTAEMESGAAFKADEGLPRLSPASVIVVPSAMLRDMGLGTLRSIAVKTPDSAGAQQLALELSKRLAFPIYYGAGEETKAIATTPLMPRAPKSLAIPLAIAGLIIFNTMLSSIAERRKEIYVYTSLGLAPVHVGFLFLAEALTYGLMGSIFGYVIGQGLATAFSKLGWMGGITLNYSGTHAIWVMVLVLLVVIVSSLIPAYLAGRLAAPSNRMRWQVPEPKDDLISDTLPFTVTGKTANGVLAYLFEYFQAHKEGNIGHFSTADLRTFRAQVDGLTAMGIEGTVWLAPYDLGVRQDMRMTIRPTGEHDIYEIEIDLRRGSGQTASWRRLNRPFLGDLRKQLLGWRKLKSERILRYIAEGSRMLEESAL